MTPGEIIFFSSQAELRRWLRSNHRNATELWIGFYKKNSGRSGIKYSEAVDEALCFGWIDGIRKSHGPECYINRFTPRRPKSIWSAINTRRVGELIEAGRMHPAGLTVFQNRDLTKAEYSYENQPRELPPALLKRFKASLQAWEYFQSQSPSYRRLITFWIMSAKQEATRERRLTKLIEACALGIRLI